MNRDKGSCYNCLIREVGCHSSCDVYRSQQERFQKIRKKRREELAIKEHVIISMNRFSGRIIAER